MPIPGLKPKDLCMVPARAALALQADGWYLRSEIIWHKPNPMPESVRDRPTKAHEQIFLLAKSERYFFNQEAVREDFADERMGNPGVYNKTSAAERKACNDRQDLGFINNGGGWKKGAENGGRNIRSVWTIATQPYPEAHFATFPEEIAKRCILAGCPEGGTVLDPFAGSGTVGQVAEALGCSPILIEAQAEYIPLIGTRCAQPSLPIGTGV
jgi:site-specific DNA-methyltransferase (cytosine-N4-specific)